MIFILAPMDDVTDTVFRRMVYDCAPFDVSMTEFTNVDGLCSAGRNNIIRKLGAEQDAGPVIAHIWGKRPENFEQIAFEIAHGLLGNADYEAWMASKLSSSEMQRGKESRLSRTDGTAIELRMQLTQQFLETVHGDDSSANELAPDFTGIDLNFGCPAKAEIRAECCSAMQQHHLRPNAEEIIKATLKGAGDMPVSFKTRLGFDRIDYTWHAFLLEFQPSMLTVHVRTTRQMSKVPAQWDAIEEIVRLRDEISPKTKIILNGDIRNRDHGEELVKKHGVDGIMIARGVFKDPFCFASGNPWESVSKSDKLALLKKHLEMFNQTWPEGNRKFAPLKKFVKIYISDFDGASELRQRIMEVNSASEALDVLKKEKI